MPRDSRPPAPPTHDLNYLPGERMAAPQAVESTSDTLWNEFNKLQGTAVAAPAATQCDPFAPTVPDNIDRQAPAPAPAPGLSLVSTLTAQEVMVEARRFNRVCPQPAEWMALYDMLPGKVQQGRIWQPPPPVTGPAWSATPPMAKRILLRDHIEWAEQHGAIGEVMTYLTSLAETQWHHMDE